MASHICVGWALDWWLLELYKITTEGFECYFFCPCWGRRQGGFPGKLGSVQGFKGHHCTDPELETLRWRSWGWQRDHAAAVGPLHW